MASSVFCLDCYCFIFRFPLMMSCTMGQLFQRSLEKTIHIVINLITLPGLISPCIQLIITYTSLPNLSLNRCCWMPIKCNSHTLIVVYTKTVGWPFTLQCLKLILIDIYSCSKPIWPMHTTNSIYQLSSLHPHLALILCCLSQNSLNLF